MNNNTPLALSEKGEIVYDEIFPELSFETQKVLTAMLDAIVSGVKQRAEEYSILVNGRPPTTTKYIGRGQAKQILMTLLIGGFLPGDNSFKPTEKLFNVERNGQNTPAKGEKDAHQDKEVNPTQNVP